MRVSSENLRMAFLNALEGAQSRILATQNQVASGKRINLPSDDPVASARVVELDAALARLDQYHANGVIAQNQLGLEEQALAGAVDNLQRVRELAVQGNNASLNDSDRLVIANELRARRDALMAIGNATDANGNYIFAGYSEKTKPFSVGAAGVQYDGDQGQRSVQIADGRFVQTGDSGTSIFERIAVGNGTFTLAAAAGNTGELVLGAGTVTNPAAWTPDTYTIEFTSPTTYRVLDGTATEIVAPTAYAPGQAIAFGGIRVELTGAPAAGDEVTVAPAGTRSIFATIDSLVATLERPIGNPAAQARLHSEMGQLLQDVDQAAVHVIDVRAELGSRLRALEQEATLNDDFSAQLTETLSELRDLDYAEALTRLSQQLFSLEAAQQAFARTQNLSLFRYL